MTFENKNDRLENELRRVLEIQEQAIDDKIQELDEMGADDLEILRRKRITELKKLHNDRNRWKEIGHGSYDELLTEREFFDAAKQSERLVTHFYRPSTWRCEIVDRHLSLISAKHMETRFVKINVEKAPFLADRFNIIMLPTIMLIKNGKTEKSIIGFDELGQNDDFKTEELKKLLLKYEVISAE